MITTFKGKKITGMLTVMPENEYDYDEETKEIATLQTRRLKKIMGFGKRRAAKETSTSSDFCVYGFPSVFLPTILYCCLDRIFLPRFPVDSQAKNYMTNYHNLKFDLVCIFPVP